MTISSRCSLRARGHTPSTADPRRPARTRQRRSVDRLARGRRAARARAGERRRDEDEQLVDEARREERRRRASGRPRAGATGRPPRRARPAPPRAGRCGARARSPRAAARGRTRAGAAGARRVDVARVEPRVVGPHRAHADGDGVGGRAQLVDEPAALLAGDPARAGHGRRGRRAWPPPCR